MIQFLLDNKENCGVKILTNILSVKIGINAIQSSGRSLLHVHRYIINDNYTVKHG